MLLSKYYIDLTVFNLNSKEIFKVKRAINKLWYFGKNKYSIVGTIKNTNHLQASDVGLVHHSETDFKKKLCFAIWNTLGRYTQLYIRMVLLDTDDSDSLDGCFVEKDYREIMGICNAEDFIKK